MYLDFPWAKQTLWLVDSWSRNDDQIQMYPDRDTIVQLLPARQIKQHDFAKWLLKGKSKYTTKHSLYGPSGNHTLSVYWYCKEKLQVHHFWDNWNWEDPVCYLMNPMGNLGNNLSSILGFFFLILMMTSY